MIVFFWHLLTGLLSYNYNQVSWQRQVSEHAYTAWQQHHLTSSSKNLKLNPSSYFITLSSSNHKSSDRTPKHNIFSTSLDFCSLGWQITAASESNLLQQNTWIRDKILCPPKPDGTLWEPCTPLLETAVPPLLFLDLHETRENRQGGFFICYKEKK